MERKIITTADGSTTIHLPEWDEQYHSKHGAVQEAYHVFIKMGLDFQIQKFSHLNILEIGFGTGLNAFITFLEAKKNNLHINYTGVEAFPIQKEEIAALNYATSLADSQEADAFRRLHAMSWEENHQISAFFNLEKQQKHFQEIEDKEIYHLIYFDAFSPRIQPELWTAEIFQKMYDSLMFNGILVTYSAKGNVRRAMEQVGFKVERLTGPPGKREMLRAIKH